MILSTSRAARGSIRKLWPSDGMLLRDHLLRLDKRSRRLRFAHGVSDAFIEDYSLRIWQMGSLVFGYVEHQEVRGAGELRQIGELWSAEAEAAFSIEASHQDLGIGTALMGRIIQSARNRGIERLYLSCLAENKRMQAIARRFHAQMSFEYGDVIGEIVPKGQNYISVMSEALEDRIGFLMAVLDLQMRIGRAN